MIPLIVRVTWYTWYFRSRDILDISGHVISLILQVTWYTWYCRSPDILDISDQVKLIFQVTWYTWYSRSPDILDIAGHAIYMIFQVTWYSWSCKSRDILCMSRSRHPRVLSGRTDLQPGCWVLRFPWKRGRMCLVNSWCTIQSSFKPVLYISWRCWPTYTPYVLKNPSFCARGKSDPTWRQTNRPLKLSNAIGWHRFACRFWTIEPVNLHRLRVGIVQQLHLKVIRLYSNLIAFFFIMSSFSRISVLTKMYITLLF